MIATLLPPVAIGPLGRAVSGARAGTEQQLVEFCRVFCGALRRRPELVLQQAHASSAPAPRVELFINAERTDRRGHGLHTHQPGDPKCKKSPNPKDYKSLIASRASKVNKQEGF